MATSVDSTTYDIESASKASGLSPGVIRMWELRYGWPRPGRRPNGYRYFSAYQIEELKRMAVLVKSGLLIGKLIENGMPKWPDQPKEVKTFRLVATPALPLPASAAARAIRDRLVEALQRAHAGRACEQLTRCAWELRLDEHLLAAWLPLVVALDEYAAVERPFPDLAAVETCARDQLKADLGRLPAAPAPLWVAPATPADGIAAGVAALSLSQQGEAARPWLWDKAPASPFIVVGSASGADWLAGAMRRVAVADLPRLRP